MVRLPRDLHRDVRRVLLQPVAARVDRGRVLRDTTERHLVRLHLGDARDVHRHHRRLHDLTEAVLPRVILGDHALRARALIGGADLPHPRVEAARRRRDVGVRRVRGGGAARQRGRDRRLTRNRRTSRHRVRLRRLRLERPVHHAGSLHRRVVAGRSRTEPRVVEPVDRGRGEHQLIGERLTCLNERRRRRRQHRSEHHRPGVRVRARHLEARLHLHRPDRTRHALHAATELEDVDLSRPHRAATGRPLTRPGDLVRRRALRRQPVHAVLRVRLRVRLHVRLARILKTVAVVVEEPVRQSDIARRPPGPLHLHCALEVVVRVDDEVELSGPGRCGAADRDAVGLVHHRLRLGEHTRPLGRLAHVLRHAADAAVLQVRRDGKVDRCRGRPIARAAPRRQEVVDSAQLVAADIVLVAGAIRSQARRTVDARRARPDRRVIRPVEAEHRRPILNLRPAEPVRAIVAVEVQAGAFRGRRGRSRESEPRDRDTRHRDDRDALLHPPRHAPPALVQTPPGDGRLPAPYS